MPVDDLRDAVRGLMGLARRTTSPSSWSFKSVADPKQYPAEECHKAAQWVVDAFADGGLQDVAMSATPDGSMAVHGHAPGPEGAPTVLLYCHYDVQPPLGEEAWTRPIWELAERDGRWYGRGSADCKGNIVMHLTALRALAGRRRLPLRGQADLRGLRGAGDRRPGGFVPDERRPAARRRDPRRRRRQLRRRRPDAHDARCAGMTSVDVTVRGLDSAMHSGMFGGPAPDPLVGLIQMLASLHDERGNTTGRRARRDADVDRASTTPPSSSAPTRTCSTA